MKELTITRKKSFADSLGKQDVYVEDGRSFDLILDEKCWAFCGDLVNGETKTFRIPDPAQRVLLLPGRGPTTKLVSAEEWVLPEGEAVSLTGKCVFNPLTGSAFRFDGEPTAEIRDKRRRCVRNGAVLWGTVLVLMALLAVFVVFLTRDPSPEKPGDTVPPQTAGIETKEGAKQTAETVPAPAGKEYSGSGITVTLPASFAGEETPFPGLGTVLMSGNLGLMFGEKTYTQEPALREMSLEEYAERTKSRAGNAAALTWEDGIPVIEYTFGAGNDGITMVIYLYKGAEAFRSLQFVLLSSDYDADRSVAAECAKTAVLSAPL